MSLARKMARKVKKAWRDGEIKTERNAKRAEVNVKTAYVTQLAYNQAVRVETMQNCQLLFMYAMHKQFKFGRERLIKLRNKMQSEYDAIKAGNVSVDEIENYLSVVEDLECRDSYLHKVEGTEKKIARKVVNELSAAFLMALLDEFNYKKSRLSAAYDCAAFWSKQLQNKAISIEEIEKELTKVMERGCK
jgi:hypothetical protein